MKRWGLVLLGIVRIVGTLTGVVGAPPISPQGKTGAKVIWTGKSGGFAISWTTADIQARLLKKPGRLAFSANQLSRRGFQTFISPPRLDGSEEHITYERKFTLLSVVGPIISLRDELYFEIRPSAHPGGETRFTAIDLSKPGKVPDLGTTEEGLRPKKSGKMVELTDYFPEQEVLKALLNHAIIQENLGGESPQSIADLLALLEGLRINEIPCLIPGDFLTSFTFHHLQGDRVAVRLGLPSVGGAFRAFYAELDLLLPIPPALKKCSPWRLQGRKGFSWQTGKILPVRESRAFPSPLRG